MKLLRFTFPADRICSACHEIETAESDERHADQLFDQARVPRDYRECEFRTFEEVVGTVVAKKLASDWARDFRRGIKPRRGLFFSGPPGSGKTHLAVSILREVVYGGTNALFVNVPEWLTSLKESWDGGPRVLSPREFTVLVVDDLGAEQSTDWSREQIYSLFNHRMANKLSTIVTSNLSLADLEERLGRATISRLIKLCSPVEIHDHVPDFRKGQVEAA